MALQINGSSVPWSAVTSAVIAIVWLAGLSFQVNANAEKLEKQATTSERLVSLETDRESTKEDIREIKEAIKAVLDEMRKANSK